MQARPFVPVRATPKESRLHQFVSSRRGRVIIAIGLAFLFVSAGLAAVYYGRDKPAASKYVALYVTDLPGGLEGLRVSILAATVGPAEVPLKVEKELVELSRLHGPNESLMIAGGDVPLDAGESVSLVFGGAEGLRDGAWIPVMVPQNRLTLQDALVNGSFDRNAVLFDFNLDASIAFQENGDVYFQPYVETAYEFHSTSEDHRQTVFEGDVTNMDWGVAINNSVSVKVDFPTQFIDSLANEIVEGLCRRMSGCDLNPLGPGGGNRFTHVDPECIRASTSTESARASQVPFDLASCVVDDEGDVGGGGGAGGGTVGDGEGRSINQPPRVPFDPRPADRATGIDAVPLLSWSGGDPDNGDSVTYEVVVDGKPACPRLQVAECRLPKLDLGSMHTWHVTATDESGNRSSSPPWTFTVAQAGQAANRAPLAPSQPSPLDGFLASTAGAQTLRWVGADPDGDLVEFQVSLGSSVTTLTVACAWSTANSCTTAPFAVDGKQSWRVDARDSKGASSQGPVWTFTITGTPVNAAPDTPSNPSPPAAATANNLNPTLSWSGGDSDGDEVTYQVLVNGAVKCTTTQRTCALTALSDGVAYTWSVTATDTPKAGASRSSPGPSWTFTVALGGQNQVPLEPATPTPPQAATGIAGLNSLTWSGADPDGDALEYQVLWGTANPPIGVQCAWSTQTSCAPPTLTAGVTYYWRVDARDGKATTVGPVWSFTANRAPDIPSGPTPTDGRNPATQNGDKSVTLSWTGGDPDGQTVEYRVFADSVENPPKALRCDWSPSTTCSTGAYLSPEVWSHWRVEARDSSGQIRVGPVWKFQVVEGYNGNQATLSDSRELHDDAPSKSLAKLVRTLEFTPGLNQYVIVDAIDGDIAYDGAARSATLSAKVLDFHSVPQGFAIRKPPASASGQGVDPVEPTVAYCSLGDYRSSSLPVNYQAPMGQKVTVEFYLHYSPPSNVQSGSQDTVTDVCLRSLDVAFRVVTVST